MPKKSDLKICLIVGYSRSGTTIASAIFRSFDDVHLEVEPHVLWRLGNFCVLNDEEYKINNKIASQIRRKMLKDIKKELFVEKSPINALRPELVHAVFPDAKIIYIKRATLQCIKSNVKYSKENRSFNLSILFKKFAYRKKSNNIKASTNKSFLRRRRLFQQLTPKDYLCFLYYSFSMLLLKFRYNSVPFGPKIRGFSKIIKKEGLTMYHIRAILSVEKHKQKFETLYGENMKSFNLEDFTTDTSVLSKMLDFAGLHHDKVKLDSIKKMFKPIPNKKETNEDKEIKKLIRGLREINSPSLPKD